MAPDMKPQPKYRKLEAPPHCIYCNAVVDLQTGACRNALCADRLQRAMEHEAKVKAILAEHEAAEQRVVDERDGYKLYLTVAAGSEVRIVTQMARDLEANNDVPDLHWHRGEDGLIDGIILVGKLSRETVSRVPELVQR